jgi:hypothetical protein
VSIFGDFDPEDAYDIGDPVGRRLDVIARVVDDLRDPDPRRELRRLNALRLLDTLGPVPSSEIPRYRTLRAELLEG